MDTLHIERTVHTPKVLFDIEDWKFEIKGVSEPDNAKKFFNPLVQWLEKFANNFPVTSVPMSIEVKLIKCNSDTMEYLIRIFKIIRIMHNKGLRVIIDWYINGEDETIKETGMELSDVTDLPFNFIED